MVVACSYKILWPKIDFLIFLPHFPLSTGHFFQNGGQVRKMQKKSFFFAEMAFTHVGTKYIKRQQDFENVWKFRRTLFHTFLKPAGTIFHGSWIFAAYLLLSIYIFSAHNTIINSAV